MKIQNNTHWRTDHLRAIIQRVVKDELSPAKRARLRVTIDYTGRNHGYSTGCAVLGGSRMTLRLAKQREYVNKTDFARVVAHEAAHLRGLEHRRMPLVYHAPHHARTEEQARVFAWAEEMPLEVKPARQKKVVDVQALRYERTLAAVKRWTTKAKRAATELRKLKTRQRYYERALAARAERPDTRESESV